MKYCHLQVHFGTIRSVFQSALVWLMVERNLYPVRWEPKELPGIPFFPQKALYTYIEPHTFQ